MDLATLVGLAGVPGLQPAVDALFQFGVAIENIKVYKHQCRKLQSQSVSLLLTLRDNAEKMVGTEYTKTIDEAEFVIQRISRKARLWASWSTLRSLYSQSEIKQGLDDLSSDLAHCVMRFNMTSHTEILDNQRGIGMLVVSNHAAMQEKLDRLLDNTNDIQVLLDQPERDIKSHMLHIQQALHADIAGPEMHQDLQRRLLSIHRRTELLPPMIDLTGEVRRIDDHPVNVSGGYSDVYLGEWLGDEQVALKLTRGINQTPRAQRRFINEVGIWRQLQHKNVARLYGVATIGNHIYTVSPWMKNLDALRYIENNPTTDRLKILFEVATGLEFLHKHGVVHGDLRAANILISDAEVACITDFGLSVLLEENSDSQSSSTAGETHGNSRWMAPELIKPEIIGLSSVKPNVHTDVWSYGMLCLEILTGERPFHNRIRIPAVINDLIDGVRPTRPPPEVTRRGLSDELWGLMERCWLQVPASRPAVTELVKRMKGYQSNHRTFSRSSLAPPSPRRSTSGTSAFNPRSSPLPIAGQSRVIIPNNSPFSTTPPAGLSNDIFSASHSSSSSNIRPSTPGSNFSELSPAVSSHTTSSSCIGLLPHNKSASFSAGIPQTKNVTLVARPATASAAETTFTRLDHIGKSRHEEVDGGYEDIMAIIRSSFGDSNDVPTVHLALPSSSSSLDALYFDRRSKPDSLSSVVITSRSSDSCSDRVGPFSTSSAPCDTGLIPDGSATMATVDNDQQRKLFNITYGKDGMVATGSLLSLIDRLIADSTDFRRDTYREIFFATYQAFTSAEEVFKLLTERFEAVSSPAHAGTKVTIISVLELWLRSQRTQTKDIPLLRRMRTFASSIEQMVTARTIITSAQRIVSLIDEQIAEFQTAPLSPIIPSSPTSSMRALSRPTDISPSALADILTKLENKRFREIIPSDCIGWLKSLHHNNGISIFLTENHKLTYWVQKSILKPDLQHCRAANLRFFLHVTDECRKRRNFSSACALFLGISSSAVTGLKRTGELDKPSAKLFIMMEELMSLEGNFRNYRESLKSSMNSFIPWLRVHLQDIKAVHESRKTYLNGNEEENIVNFELYCDIYQRVQELLSYGFKPIPNSPPANHTESSSSSDIHSFIEKQLNSLVVNDSLRDWLERRATKLSQEELKDYHNHTQELVAAGFLPQTR